MGLDARFTNNLEHDRVDINPEQHRRLGMHLCEYAQRSGIDSTELVEMLAMIGLRDGYAD